MAVLIDLPTELLEQIYHFVGSIDNTIPAVSHRGPYLPPTTDLIDIIVRSKLSRKPPYPLMTLPVSTERCIRPTRNLAYSSNFDLYDDRYKRIFQRTSNHHLSLITHSSFHQTQSLMTILINSPTSAQALYALPDHAKKYFADKAMLAFEMYESWQEGAKKIRIMFPEKWHKMLWSVWWWANSEGKARAKMERWRAGRV
ncbi:hypothetical protein EJ02DRAFT_438469 [Clathrospora elynae]|uniref:Uncharacterized protein n=1 Tax=Clathrospora elynae TaxID=706981 RepID=A0A6A5SDN0_9PLEO|nr:hypothetical protein EJ02DRAFT_438469 [Clathrospora elynae]